jgi:hypothetical protein
MISAAYPQCGYTSHGTTISVLQSNDDSGMYSRLQENHDFAPSVTAFCSTL